MHRNLVAPQPRRVVGKLKKRYPHEFLPPVLGRSPAQKPAKVNVANGTASDVLNQILFDQLRFGILQESRS